ncbi:glycerol-3-phosphate transcriptional regulator protein [Labrys okinawensis]|uniref:Glycerol-3-phosphate transcriptional regulator protein n=1 Tax=Labrys okinawensis TaxID=346911 RepID=A0A2S9QB60_9HYPH|nr:DeoR/GlpR family DNA-binding transcription regulator [Labrys okinawensis]PRH86587.1 glycerol-3-phosphate transcriptional regulator protein [Labrys okinawensis]
MTQLDEYGLGDGTKKSNRQAELLRLLERSHYLSIEEIAERFAVTTQTARRDIIALEATGRVRRLHGGATISTPVDAVTRRQRRIENASHKARVAALVAQVIPDGAAIFMDTGTTCEAIAHALLQRRDLRIVTYSLRVATIFSENSNFALAIPGGFVRPVDGGVFREDTADYIRRFKFDYAIISVSGIDQAGDICDDDYAEVSAVTAALAQTERTILAVDSTKFGKRALVRLGSLEDVDILVCDNIPAPFLDRIRQSGIETHVASAVAQEVPLEL